MRLAVLSSDNELLVVRLDDGPGERRGQATDLAAVELAVGRLAVVHQTVHQRNLAFLLRKVLLPELRHVELTSGLDRSRHRRHVDAGGNRVAESGHHVIDFVPRYQRRNALAHGV